METPTPTHAVWTHHSGSFGGISPCTDERHFVNAITRHGHAIVIPSSYQRPMNHHIIGVGIGHDDAKFAESGDSFAAYIENGDPFGGRWWEKTTGVTYHGISKAAR